MKAPTLKIYLLTSSLLFTGGTAFGQATPPATTQAPTNLPWDVTGSAGLTLTRGNSHTLLFVAKVVADKKWDGDREQLDLDADGAYGTSTVDGATHENTDQVHGFAQYNHLFTERFYGLFRIEALHDRIADIDYRLTVTPGVGYYFIKEANDQLRGEAGGGVITEKDHDPEHGNPVHTYAVARAAERYEHKFNPNAKLWQTLEFLPGIPKVSNYIINGEIGIEAKLTKRLSEQTYIVDSYHSHPADKRLNNDVKLVAAIAYKF